MLDMPLLDTSVHRDLTGTLIADIVLQLLSYVAQSERENIRKRQSEGIAAAKARGVLLGRPAKEMPEDFDQWYLRWRSREIIATEIEVHCGVDITTILRHAKKQGLPYTPTHQPGKCKSTDTQNTPSS